MPQVTKQITQGASFGPTVAAGDIDTVLKTGIMCCGSGDDHTLLLREMKQLRNHTGSENIVLKPGRLGIGRNQA